MPQLLSKENVMRIAIRVAGVLLAAGALGGLGSLAATAYADAPAQPSATANSGQAA